MTKDVLISLNSIQYDIGDIDSEGSEDSAVPGSINATENSANMISGLYYMKNGNHYILYDELMEGVDKPLKTRVKFKKGIFEIVRSGAVNTSMLFEEHKKNMTSYNTPYGSVLLGINTKKIDISEQENVIEINIDYELEAEGGHLADCSMTMKIESRN